MPLIVPFLRLAMLFLNIYDSYKTLRVPPPSSRNNGRPSVRALSQRKRDMKGCLAVWIVWCCFTTYERVGEGIVSLFIPFYDEFKSLVLLFLIVTRARGAEPVYLHVIRPFLKPYTPTLDLMLDLVCMVGDILLIMATFPFRLTLAWWEKIVGTNEETLESEPEGIIFQAMRSARPGAQAEVQFTPTMHHGEASEPRVTKTPPFPRKASQSRHHAGPPFPRPSAERAGNNVQSCGLSGDTTRSRSTGSTVIPDERQSQSHTDTEEEGFISETIREVRNPDGISDLSKERGEIIPDQGLVDEWRQYPPFPSAYPPTPLVDHSQLPTSIATVRSHRRPSGSQQLPNISEHVPPQDFRPSLLPPREPLDLGFVGDSSDDDHSLGVRNDRKSYDAMTIDTDGDSELDRDEEDEFNMTLKTPLPLSGIVRSQMRVPPNHLPSPASSSDTLPSRSTALTTIYNGSSLCTRTSSESSSGAISNPDVSALLGKKRSFPPAKVIPVGGRNHPNGPRKVGSIGRIIPKSSTRRRIPRRARNALRPETSTSETVDDDPNTSSSAIVTDEGSVSDRKLPEIKKRKVVKSPTGVVKCTWPPRSRITRSATTPPSRIQPKTDDGPSNPIRSSTRLRSQSTMPIAEASGNPSLPTDRIKARRERLGLNTKK